MRKSILLLFAISLFVIYSFFTSCNSGQPSIPSDTASIANGKTAFIQNCSGCHNFRQDGIGPKLGGITEQVSPQWIENFIKDPQKSIESGDARSKLLYEKYHTVMPSFANFSHDQLEDIIAYIHSQKIVENEKIVIDSNYIKDPIVPKIEMSSIVAGVQEVTRIPASSETTPRTRINKLDYMPGSKKLFVLDLRGKLYTLNNGQPELYMDIQSLRKQFIHEPGLGTGFGSFAFHPEFEKNGLLYTTHTESPGSAPADFRYSDSIEVTLQWVISEWKTDKPGEMPFRGEGRELFRINMVTAIHGVQDIHFNPYAKPGGEDYGLLYIGIGDGGSVESNYASIVRSTQSPWGTVFRIDPKGRNSANGKYGIPEKNPLRTPGALKEIYAYGFRNPHRLTWNSSGQLMVTNIGQAHIESLNYIIPGHDYGWPIREGNFLVNPYGDITKIYPLPPDDANYQITYPVAQYDHDEGMAISGGFEYVGSAVPAFKGKYLFGDIAKGRLFYVEMNDLKLGSFAPIKEWQVALNGKKTKLSSLCGDRRVDLRFGMDADGELYILTKTDGKVYRLTTP